MNAANPKFAKYSNGPIEGIDRKIKLLRRLSFSMSNFTNMKKRIILWLNFKPKKKNSKKIALISYNSLKMMHIKFWVEPFLQSKYPFKYTTNKSKKTNDKESINKYLVNGWPA